MYLLNREAAFTTFKTAKPGRDHPSCAKSDTTEQLCVLVAESNLKWRAQRHCDAQPLHSRHRMAYETSVEQEEKCPPLCHLAVENLQTTESSAGIVPECVSRELQPRDIIRQHPTCRSPICKQNLLARAKICAPGFHSSSLMVCHEVRSRFEHCEERAAECA